jgi:hypothetical protein
VTYHEWMRAYLFQAASGYGLASRCGSATAEMQAAFPELVRVPGRVTLVTGERICHWWCVTPGGSVLDPTAAQFPAPVAAYIPMAEEDPKPTGQCLECWDYRYGKGGYCSSRCYRRNYRKRKDDPEYGLAMVMSVLAAMHEG